MPIQIKGRSTFLLSWIIKCINDRNPSYPYMEKNHKIFIRKCLFLSLYFIYFADLLSEQSKLFVQQIFVLHTFQDNSDKFLILSFLAALRICMMQTMEVILLASKNNYVIKFYLSYITLQFTVVKKSKIKWRNHNLCSKTCCLTKNVPSFVKKHTKQHSPGKKKIPQIHIQTASSKE